MHTIVVDQREISTADREEYRRGLPSPSGWEGSVGWDREALTTAAQILESI